ncbi:MAG: preprotein translocase subunit SecY [Ruminococcus sp.]|nr:preprotein translocase subunit SecY [Candidatus Apopatosoma intestinale]
MFKTIKNAFTIPELRSKILFTLFIIVLYRVGAAVPVPFTSLDILLAGYSTTGIMNYLSLLSGSAFQQGTLFALGVSPYITASIVIQLLTVAIPALERMAKEGETGKQKLEKLTRYTTVGLAIITAVGYYMLMENQYGLVKKGYDNWFGIAVIISCYVAGASIVMWLGERIDEQGIGNGISILLFANIVSSLPNQIMSYAATLNAAEVTTVIVIVMAVLAVLLTVGNVVFVTAMSDAERRIPVQYAKRVVGRKMYGGQNTNLPIKLNMSGVMPIIFANTLVSLPATILLFVNPKEGTFWYKVQHALDSDSWIYIVVLFVLIIAFAYFYISISFNPIEVSNNLMQNGGFIPGIRPGKPTAMYITKILNKVTLMGAFFLSIVACVPLILNIVSGGLLGIIAFSGSTMLIVVGVIMETIREIEAQMTMRHYKGFLDN